MKNQFYFSLLCAFLMAMNLQAQITITGEDTGPLWNPCIDHIEYTTPSNFSLGSMNGIYTYQEVLDNLDQMYSLYPNLITEKANIGNFLTQGIPDNTVTPSIGGNGIKWVKISDNPTSTNEGEPQVLYITLISGQDRFNIASHMFFMWYLLENYDSDPQIKQLLDNTELYFIPVANPDALLYNEVLFLNGENLNWHKNRVDNGDGTIGVNIALNFDYYVNGDPTQGVWGGGPIGASDPSMPSSGLYHGTGPLSEVESQAIKWFVEQHNFKIALNHRFGQYDFHQPFIYEENAPTPENDLFKAFFTGMTSQIDMRFRKPPHIWPGSLVDFLYGTMGTHEKIYAIDIRQGSYSYVIDDITTRLNLVAKKDMHLNLVAAKNALNYGYIESTGEKYLGNSLNQFAPFDFQRTGIGGNGNFTISLNPISDNFATVGPEVTFNNLSEAETVNGSIDYTLEPSIQNGESIVYQLIVDSGIYEDRILVEKRYGALDSLVVLENGQTFEETFINDGWGTTTESYVTSFVSITDSPNGPYPVGTYKTLELQQDLDLTEAARAQVSFWAKWELEDFAFDFVQFQISLDGGISWEAPCGLYNTQIMFDDFFAPDFEPLYFGQQYDWIHEKIDLQDYLGNVVRLRFLLDADGFEPLRDGFYIDEFKVETIDESSLGVSDTQLEGINIYPNPTQDILNIQTTLQAYQLEVVNIQGQQILQMDGLSGNQQISLERLAAGLYFVNIISEEGNNTFKIIKK